MGNSRKVWLACGASLGMPFAGAAQSLRHVEVTEAKGSVSVHIVGDSLPKPRQISGPGSVTLEWAAGLSCKSDTISVDSPEVTNVWYGWFSTHPRKVRVRVDTKKTVATTVTKTDDGWTVTLVTGQAGPSMAPITDLKPVVAPEKDSLPPTEKIWVDPHATFGAAQPKPHHQQAGVMPTKPAKTESQKSASWTGYQPAKVQSPRSGSPMVQMPRLPAPRMAEALVPAEEVLAYKRVSIDCTNADLAQILKGLALQSGANIIIAPSVAGKVTADLHNVTVEQALNYISFLTGVKYVKMDGTYVFGADHDLSRPAGNPEALAPRVARVVPIVSGEADRVKLAVKSTIGGAELSIYTPAEKMATDGLQAAVGGQGDQPGAPPKAPSTQSSDNKESNYLLLVGPEDEVEEAEKIAKDIDNSILTARTAYRNADQTSWRGDEIYAYDVKYADPRALGQALELQVPGLHADLTPVSVGDFTSYDEGQKYTHTQKQQAKDDKTSEKSDQNQQPATSGATGVSTQNVSDADLEQPFTKEEAISIPMRLVLRGDHDKIQLALRYLDILDVAPKQVAIELRVMTLTKEQAINAGIDWNVLSGGAVKILNLNNAVTNPSNLIGVSISGKNFNGDVTASLDRLSNSTNLIARPNLIAMDGRQSELFVGDIVRYIESIQSSQNGTTITTGEVPVGVRLSVLPRIGANGVMTLDLRPRLSILNSFTQVPGGGELPQTSTRFAQSTVSVKSGETIAIGGLIQDQDIKNTTGIPFLMDLPIIGHLFKKTNNDKQRTEVVIFLTAKAIDGPVHADNALPMEHELSVNHKGN